MPRKPPRASALQRVLHAIVVVALIGVGIVSTVVGALSDCTNFEPACTDTPTTSTTVRAMLAWLLQLMFIFYRSRPRLVAGTGAFIGLVLGFDPFMLAVALTVLLSRMGTPGDRRWVVAGYAALLGVFGLQFWRLLTTWPAGEGRSTGVWLLVGALVLTFTVVTTVGLAIRARREARNATDHAGEEAVRNEQLSEELFRQKEREDLAREVHDTLASRLTSISLQSGTLEDQFGDGDARSTARNVRRNASEALADLRTLLSSLREGGAQSGPPSKDLHTGLAELLDLIEDAAASGLTIHPVIALDGYATAPEILRRAVFRITQEALTNALRHSSDHTVVMRIEGAAGGGLRMSFRNGADRPSSYEGGAGEGLKGLRERVRLLGGSFERSHVDGVHNLDITLPWPLA